MSSTTSAPRLPTESLIQHVARAYGVSPATLIAPSRDPLLVEARRVTMGLLAERGLGPTHIGRTLCRDPSTVLHHLARLRQHPTVEEQAMLVDLRALPRVPDDVSTPCITPLTGQGPRG